MTLEEYLRFAFLHHDDPVSPTLWSGIPLNLVRTLELMGHTCTPVGLLKPHSFPLSRLKSAFYKFLRKQMYSLNRDPAVIRQRTFDAEQRINAIQDLDAVVVTYLPDAAFLKTRQPVILIGDATWAQMLDYYPGYEKDSMAPETIEGGMRLDKNALLRCCHAIYSSQWAAESVLRDYRIEAGKVSVAPFGASLGVVPSQTELTELRRTRSEGPLRLFFLGKEWIRKGGDVAVEIALEIQRRNVPVELHVVGCTPDGPLPDCVQVHGHLSKEDPVQWALLLNLFRNSDFLILPTRAEAFGIVFAEAAAFGLPVIASSTGGVVEATLGGWSSILPLDGCVSKQADWAIGAYQDRRLYCHLSELARNAYEERLNWEKFCDHLVSVVHDTYEVRHLDHSKL